RRRSQRVAGERRERGGVRALAADVSERDRPAAAAGLEDVVEVAADVVRLAGRPEARGDLEPGDVGQVGREEALLQPGGDIAALSVEPRVVDGYGGPPC